MRSLVITFSLALLLALAVAHDTLRLTPVQQLSVRYHFNLVGWEVANLPAKWFHWLGNAAFPFRQESGDRMEAVQEYFRLRQEAGALRGDLDRAVATAEADASDLEQRLEDLQRQTEELRPQVEETLEAAITDLLREEDVPFGVGGFIFPPVDFALDRLPSWLVTSLRHRIQRMEDVLLAPGLPVREREALEERIARQEDISALVTGIGGISTYPAILSPNDLRNALVTASHEWLHNYLFLRPLGQRYNRDADMSSLNETTANIFGEELGDRVFARLTGEVPLPRDRGPQAPCPEDRFCFDQEMCQTRQEVDRLLEEDKVEEAEAYMEQRRQVFVEQGYYIRKLNQAYFAFHGTYADSPASVSPIYEQLQEVRQASASLGAFIHTMDGISSYDEFATLLDTIRGG